MALKQKIDKAAFDALPADVQKEYKALANGTEWALDVEGLDDPAELRRALARERQAAKDEKARADALQQAADERDDAAGQSEAEKARKAGDVATLEKSWRAKRDEDVGKEAKAREKAEKALRDRLVNDEALRIATAISSAPSVILPHIQARLQADLEADVPTTRVLDANGAPSAATISDLQQEFVARPEFAAIIIGSKASGGGAAGGLQNSGGGAPKKFADMDGTERAEYFKRDPAGFKKASDAAREGGPRI